MESVLKRWLPVLAVVAGLLVAGLAAAGPGLSGVYVPREDGLEDRLDDLRSSPSAEPQSLFGEGRADAAERDQLGSLAPVVITIMVGALVALAALVLFLLLRWLLVERVRRTAVLDRAASQPEDGDAAAAQVRDTLRAGLADLDAGGDPRRVVIACWLRLERVAARVGAARQVADTPAELVTRLLATHHVDDAALRRLAGAYRAARYAPSSVDDSLVETAREALREVDAQLVAGVRR